MKPAALCVLFTSAAALATPSGHRWFLDPCTAGSCPLASGTANGNRACVAGKCLPEVRLAASIDNSGGQTLPGRQRVPYSAALAATRVAFERWTLTNGSCSPSIRFAYEATPFTSPAGTQAVNSLDNENNVIWLSGPNWRHSSITLGLTTNTWYPNGELSDSDLEMNAGTVSWSATGAGGDYDFESVLTHEAGHFIGFAHSPDTIAVMFASMAPGEIKRNLQGPDFNDVCTVYPGATGTQGSSCNVASMCQSGLVCEGRAGTASKVCTSDCASAASPCSAGYSCQPSTDGFACLPQIGPSDMCKFCTGGQDCSTGTCLTDGMGQNWCSMACNPSLAGQCGAGYSCQTTPAGNYCIPSAGCPNQCTPATVASACAPGYVCTQGTCAPSGAVGDRCEISEVCANCAVCATDEDNPQLAFCRACCNGGGPLCTGCSSTACAAVNGASTQCLSIPMRNEQLCYPAPGAVAVCQACTAGQTCAGGAPCIGGKCRAACNPQNPGGCPACLPSVNGGICACGPSEVSDANQPCASAGSVLAICRSGLSCVSGFCRARCTASRPSSCPAGSSCQGSGGVEVCLPNEPGRQCAPCRAGACDPGLQCLNDRCYPACTPSSPSQCSTCVQTQPDPPLGSGAGVCACPDQVVGPGASCSSGIASCQPGTKCLDGVCQPRCDPNDGRACPDGTRCVSLAQDFYCSANMAQGGGAAGGGSTSAGGGGTPSTGGGTPASAGGAAGGSGNTTSSSNCGCTSLGWEPGAFLFAALAYRFRSRRLRGLLSPGTSGG